VKKIKIEDSERREQQDQQEKKERGNKEKLSSYKGNGLTN
jgi:hypothetical protein